MECIMRHESISVLIRPTIGISVLLISPPMGTSFVNGFYKWLSKMTRKTWYVPVLLWWIPKTSTIWLFQRTEDIEDWTFFTPFDTIYHKITEEYDEIPNLGKTWYARMEFMNIKWNESLYNLYPFSHDSGLGILYKLFQWSTLWGKVPSFEQFSSDISRHLPLWIRH